MLCGHQEALAGGLGLPLPARLVLQPGGIPLVCTAHAEIEQLHAERIRFKASAEYGGSVRSRPAMQGRMAP